MGRRNGDWFFWGSLATLVIQRLLGISAGWLLAIALAVGWAINETERRQKMEKAEREDGEFRDR